MLYLCPRRMERTPLRIWRDGRVDDGLGTVYTVLGVQHSALDFRLKVRSTVLNDLCPGRTKTRAVQG